MNPQWARDIVKQCTAADVPVFVKQMGSAWAASENPHGSVRERGDTKGANMKYWPEDLRVREFPIAHPGETDNATEPA